MKGNRSGHCERPQGAKSLGSARDPEPAEGQSQALKSRGDS